MPSRDDRPIWNPDQIDALKHAYEKLGPTMKGAVKTFNDIFNSVVGDSLKMSNLDALHWLWGVADKHNRKGFAAELGRSRRGQQYITIDISISQSGGVMLFTGKMKPPISAHRVVLSYVEATQLTNLLLASMPPTHPPISSLMDPGPIKHAIIELEDLARKHLNPYINPPQPWADPNADPIKNLHTWIDEYANMTGKPPNHMEFGGAPKKKHALPPSEEDLCAVCDGEFELHDRAHDGYVFMEATREWFHIECHRLLEGKQDASIEGQDSHAGPGRQGTPGAHGD